MGGWGGGCLSFWLGEEGGGWKKSTGLFFFLIFFIYFLSTEITCVTFEAYTIL